jgi:phosphate acyltransferase
MKIGLDIMGGDFAPVESCLGVKQFLSSGTSPDVTLVALGPIDILESMLGDVKSDRLEFIDAPELVAMNEHPTKIFREKPQSSFTIGFGILAQGKIDAFISAGNTGAMLVGATMIIKPIPGVARPTIPTIVPYTNGNTAVLLDVGINADCKPENLEQFGVLGSNYAEHTYKITQPRVGLLNIGEEEGKGNLLAKAAFDLLKVNPHINFIGNIEGRDLFMDKADVIVCDGFTGNIVLKLSESIYHLFAEERGIKDEYLERFDHNKYAGTPVLGINKTVIVAHGISKADAFERMITQANDLAKSNLPETLKGKFEVGV